MAPIHLITLILIMQILGYFLLDKYGFKKWKYLVFGLILILHLFVLPNFFIPKYKEGEFRCGMPIMAIYMVFWFIGGGLTIIFHFGYVLVKKITK
ncbi:hypothetical protein [Flavobacterium eburneipallidum]|uniref:hypothetical protein n=1 Tax=Flavobacterium eburneipallidum TaxID=3003263 RepID=UPI002482F313|nr:hypothetical protein [Flavobacterium eburneipallidum]